MISNALRLIDLLAAGKVHQTVELAEQLHCSMDALFVTIQHLQEWQIAFQHCNRQQIQLAFPLQRFSAAHLHQHTSVEIQQLSVLPIANSTNDVVWQSSAKQHICLADYQLKGRGQHGRSWIAPFAGGICLSIKQAVDTGSIQLQAMPMALAAATVKTLQQLGLTNAQLKWPNDVYVGQQKLAGLLIETRQQQQQTTIVVGIGLNWRLPFIDEQRIDLATVLSVLPSRLQVTALLIESICNALSAYQRHGFAAFHDIWQQ